MIKQKALIIDLDWTLCDPSARQWLFDMEPKDWDQIYEHSKLDLINEWCKNIAVNYGKLGYKIIFLTARDESCFGISHDWLTNNLPIDLQFSLMMRKAGDTRPDYVIKEEIYNMNIREFYDVEFCIDDKQAVIDMWRNNGLVALQCMNRF